MTFVLGKSSLARLVGVHPNLVRVVKRAIQITAQDFCVNDGARTAEEQNALFRKGVSQKDGYRNRSNHQKTADGTGHAVDLVPWVGGKPEFSDWNFYYPVAVAMSLAAKEIGVRIRWGGNWYERMNDYGSTLEDVKAAVERYKAQHPGPDFIDGPHFEWAP